ncbi:MAG: 6,7-dimethyl-8-ribityllumazine synthase [Bacteroidetes bacterium]|nr:6,7-dimethyl-8-ribityllumazine synthase [Bacteroidota bacterium]
MKMGIVVSEWNDEITRALLYGTLQTLSSHDVAEENVLVRWVPGSFELPLSASLMLENELVDAVICLGCVIQGETRHFEFICQAVAQGITQVGLQYKKPVVFGVLTTDTISQARERSGGKYGNKGIEAALAAIRMVALSHDLRSLLP